MQCHDDNGRQTMSKKALCIGINDYIKAFQ